MKKIVIILFSIIWYAAYSGDPKFPVNEIPEELKKDVNIVVREDKMVYRIMSKSEASLYAYYVVTILNDKGKWAASRSFGYDKLSRIKVLNAYAYDASGKQIKRIRNSEIVDHSAYDGYSLFSDNRVKAVDLTQSEYPYTVEYEYEMEYKFLYDFGGSMIISSEKVSVQHASYQLIYPTDLPPRYKTLNTEVKPRQEKMADLAPPTRSNSLV